MGTIYILSISVALALDAFAVSFGAGSYFKKTDAHQKFRLSFHFGLFQGIMPIIGWFLGVEVLHLIKDLDHWVAFAILVAIGGKMIFDAITGKSEKLTKDITKGVSLISLSIATSIDALAVGFSIGIINEPIVFPAISIAVITALLSLLGIYLGERLSSIFGSKIEIFGGVVLIFIGIKILTDHLDHISLPL